MTTNYKTEVIGDNEKAYITSKPEMPKLKAEIKGAPADLEVEWKLEIKSERSERKQLDDKKYPEDGSFKKLPGNEAWDIFEEFGEDFTGGKATLTYRVKGQEGKIEFKIRGKNAKDSIAKAYIKGKTPNYPYAWAMAQHESREPKNFTSYNQFNTVGSVAGTPFFGPPDGWGIGQIDRFSEKKIVTSKEVYNWHENVSAMVDKLDEKKAVAVRILGYFKNTYGGSSKWEEPPTSYKISDSNFSAQEIAIMVLYNGVAGCPEKRVKRPDGKFVTVTFPWYFDSGKTAGNRWIFKDNKHDYASSRVIPPEWEGKRTLKE
jgi:hypothetical protein